MDVVCSCVLLVLLAGSCYGVSLTTFAAVYANVNGTWRSCTNAGAAAAGCNAEITDGGSWPTLTRAYGYAGASSSWGFLHTSDSTSVYSPFSVFAMVDVYTTAAFRDEMSIYLPGGGSGSSGRWDPAV